MGNSLLPGREFCFGAWAKLIRFMVRFRLTYVSPSNLSTMNLKLFCNHDGIYRFEKKFKKYPREISLLRIHRNIRGCIIEVNSEGLGWQSTVCGLPFCWPWPEGLDIFRKRGGSRTRVRLFWNRGYRHL